MVKSWNNNENVKVWYGYPVSLSKRGYCFEPIVHVDYPFELSTNTAIKLIKAKIDKIVKRQPSVKSDKTWARNALFLSNLYQDLADIATLTLAKVEGAK